MIRLVRTLAPLALVLTALGAPATAAPLPCKRVTDETGDTKVAGQPTVEPSLDILSADIATDTKLGRLAVVIRPAQMLPASTGYNRRYVFTFQTPDGRQAYLYATSGLEGQQWAYGAGIWAPYGLNPVTPPGASPAYNDSLDAGTRGSVDASKGEITVTASAKFFGVNGSGQRLKALRVQTESDPTIAFNILTIWWDYYVGPGDEASTTAVYVTGSRTCLAVPK